MLFFIFSSFLLGFVNCELFSDEINARLPRLFHLDDYTRCLSAKDGLYCEGELQLHPMKYSPDYKLIQEYSSNPYTFNRSVIHRGYCVSSRCPSSEMNATLRFERCASQRARNRALYARVRSARCISHQEKVERDKRAPDEAQQLFIRVIYTILLLNFVGTAYDFLTTDSKKNGLITAWSIRSSWGRLMATYDEGDPRLKNLEPAQGLRVVAVLLTMYAHATFLHYQYYISNPQFLEKLTFRSDGVVLSNGTSIIQMFVMLSTFLTAYNILIITEKHQLKLYMIPMFILKRVVRILPIHLLVVGFAATWWPYAREGPMMASVVADESAICRRKFWSHVFFVNNIVDPQNICLIPTWFLPVDMHMYILACILTIIMSRRRHIAVKMYAALVVISSIVCGVIVYMNGWRTMVYFAKPNLLRGSYRNEESFWKFYTSSWGALPSCFMGLFMAHLHYELEKINYDFTKAMWLRRPYSLCFPIGCAWALFLGKYIRDFENRFVMAVYAALDRPCVCLYMFMIMFGLFNIKGPVRRCLAWSGWRVIARMSLPIMLAHWCINAVIAARPYAYESSVLNILIDNSATIVFTLITSLLLSILVEIPVQKFMSKILF